MFVCAIHLAASQLAQVCFFLSLCVISNSIIDTARVETANSKSEKTAKRSNVRSRFAQTRSLPIHRAALGVLLMIIGGALPAHKLVGCKTNGRLFSLIDNLRDNQMQK